MQGKKFGESTMMDEVDVKEFSSTSEQKKMDDICKLTLQELKVNNGFDSIEELSNFLKKTILKDLVPVEDVTISIDPKTGQDFFDRNQKRVLRVNKVFINGEEKSIDIEFKYTGSSHTKIMLGKISLVK